MFKFGEKIEVSCYGKHWEERIFVALVPRSKEPYVCCWREYEKELFNGDSVPTRMWKFARPIQPKLEITVKLNGKDISPSTISKETWLKLRSENSG